jgi:hypothetical protein
VARAKKRPSPERLGLLAQAAHPAKPAFKYALVETHKANTLATVGFSNESLPNRRRVMNMPFAENQE